MAQTHSKSRQHAEIAFGKAQSQFLERQGTAEGGDPVAIARAEKTLRLREARLAKEAEDRPVEVVDPKRAEEA